MWRLVVGRSACITCLGIHRGLSCSVYWGWWIGGDVLFNGGVGRTDLPGSNPEDMMLSLKRVASEFDDDDTVLPGHGPQTTVGQEKKTNPFLHEVQ